MEKKLWEKHSEKMLRYLRWATGLPKKRKGEMKSLTEILDEFNSISNGVACKYSLDILSSKNIMGFRRVRSIENIGGTGGGASEKFFKAMPSSLSKMVTTPIFRRQNILDLPYPP